MFDGIDLIIGSVIVGFLVNVLSNVATPIILQRWRILRQDYSHRNARHRAEIDEKIAVLAADTNELLAARLERNLWLARRIYFCVYSLLLLNLAGILAEVANFVERRVALVVVVVLILMMYLLEVYQHPPRFGYSRKMLFLRESVVISKLDKKAETELGFPLMR